MVFNIVDKYAKDSKRQIKRYADEGWEQVSADCDQ